jgi:hypothetical protein
MSRIVPLLLLLAMAGGCKAGPVKIAATMIRAGQQTRDLTAKQLAAAMRTKHAECKRKHGPKTPEFAACVKKVLEAQSAWAKYARPVVDTTASAASAALKTKAIVDKCKQEKNCAKVVLAIMKPGVCAIMRGLAAFGALLADAGASILTALKPFEGVTCGD